MNQIEIIEDYSDNPCDLNDIRIFIDEVLNLIGVRNWSLGLMITDNSRMRAHNLKWRGIDDPTDVLAFSQREGVSIPSAEKYVNEIIESGDIVVSLEKIEEQSRELDRPFEEEIRRVIIHGILHLRGMNHPEDDYEGSMLKLQEWLVCETQSLAVNN